MALESVAPNLRAVGSLRAWGRGGGGGGEGKVYKPANADLGVFPALT